MGTHTDIDWREWGEEAFRRAQEEGKPILLDLSAVWCHWCHVMDETSYSDDEVIRTINQDFIPLRVDIDQRPDIRERYNFGGYPTTAFLNGDGDVIAGGTYIPPDDLKKALARIKNYFDETGGAVRERRTPPEAVVASPKGGLSMEIFDEVLGALLERYDEMHGGFGNAPKFPQPDALDLALYQYTRSGNDHFRRMVEKSLDAMAQRGMYDHEEGGFYRYSVTRSWSEPHYEKMLEVNAGLLRNYLHAYAVLEEDRFREVAEDVLRYLEANLRDPEGGFHASQDADEEYYGLSRSKREEREAPYIDETLYADLNGQAVAAYFLASAVLDADEYRDAALTSLRTVASRLMRKDGTLYHVRNGDAEVDGLLSDYVRVGQAFLAAYEHTGESEHLERTSSTAGAMLDTLRDEGGLLRDRQPREDDIGLLKVGQKPLVDNAHAALLLLKLQEANGEERFGKAAAEILEGFSGQYQRYSLFSAPYAVAVEAHLQGVLKLDLVGARDDPEVAERHGTLLRRFVPRRVVRWLPPGTAAFEAAQYPEEPVPAVYACVGTRCSAPIEAPDPWEEIEAFRETVAV